MQPQLGAQVVLADAVTVGAGPPGKDSHTHTSCTPPGPTLPGNPWDAPWGGLDSFCRPRVSREPWGLSTWGLSFKPAEHGLFHQLLLKQQSPFFPPELCAPLTCPVPGWELENGCQH